MITVQLLEIAGEFDLLEVLYDPGLNDTTNQDYRDIVTRITLTGVRINHTGSSFLCIIITQ